MCRTTGFAGSRGDHRTGVKVTVTVAVDVAGTSGGILKTYIDDIPALRSYSEEQTARRLTALSFDLYTRTEDVVVVIIHAAGADVAAARTPWAQKGSALSETAVAVHHRAGVLDTISISVETASPDLTATRTSVSRERTSGGLAIGQCCIVLTGFLVSVGILVHAARTSNDRDTRRGKCHVRNHRTVTVHHKSVTGVRIKRDHVRPSGIGRYVEYQTAESFDTIVDLVATEETLRRRGPGIIQREREERMEVIRAERHDPVHRVVAEGKGRAASGRERRCAWSIKWWCCVAHSE